MADDISKKITIEVEAQTDKLQQNIAGLNQIINELLANQQKLTSTGNENSAAFEKTAAAVDKYQKQLAGVTKQISSFNSTLKSSTSSLQKSQSLIEGLAKANDKLAKSISSGESKLKGLDISIKALASSAQSQQASTNKSKTALDAHSKSMAEGIKQSKKLQTGIGSVSKGLKTQQSHVKKSETAFGIHQKTLKSLAAQFNKLGGITGTFGPVLSEASKGFNFLKTGLSIAETGFKGVGAAIGEAGFGLLVEILQKVIDYFAHTTKGTKILQGVFSAVGTVVDQVTGTIDNFKTIIIDALTHPIESIKALGKMIMENIINRFTAFSVILDGILHLDFKKIANGAVQALTGVSDATDKIAVAFTKVKDGIVKTTGQMVKAYNDGYTQATTIVDVHEKKVKESYERMIGYSQKYKKEISGNDSSQRTGPLEQGHSAGVTPDKTNSPTDGLQLNTLPLAGVQDSENKVVAIKKTALQQVEDYAKQSTIKIATSALSALNAGIKQQSDAKIKAMEADKANELNNSSLTSAQKLAIQNKYKKQEDAIKAKAFKQEQEINIAKTLMTAATAEIKLWDDPGFPLAIAMSAVLAAETAAQIATIAKQKPPAMAKGGHFKSDGKGAVLSGYSRSDDTNAYLRSGEAVVVSEAIRDPWARNLVSAINVAYGGRDFSVPNLARGYAVGGIFTDGGNANRYYNQPVNDQKNLANTVAYQMINNFPPVYVDVKDVNNQQNILAQTVNRVNL
ncbi:MAG: hypothetical protein JWP37_3456 [Mucilaginibacter sp.]|nr:hypothetical protein [Mucilaginibacter sp.]